MYRDATKAGAPAARLFLALWPPVSVREALEQAARQWAWPAGARLTRPERLHATLHFIGSVPGARLDELRSRLAVPFEPFSFEVSRPQVWRGGIAVLEALQPPPAMVALHSRLAARLGELGLPVEDRPYRAHVTLARKAGGASPPAAIAPITWHANEGYRLVRTLPGGGGYEPLAGFS